MKQNLLIWSLLLLSVFSCKKEETILPISNFENLNKTVKFDFQGTPTLGFSYLFRSTIYYINQGDTIFINKDVINRPVNDSCHIYFDLPVGTTVNYYFDMFRGTTLISAKVDTSIVIDNVIRTASNCQFLSGKFRIN